MATGFSASAARDSRESVGRSSPGTAAKSWPPLGRTIGVTISRSASHRRKASVVPPASRVITMRWGWSTDMAVRVVEP